MKPLEPGNCFLALFFDGGNFFIFRVETTTMFRTAFFVGPNSRGNGGGCEGALKGWSRGKLQNQDDVTCLVGNYREFLKKTFLCHCCWWTTTTPKSFWFCFWTKTSESWPFVLITLTRWSYCWWFSNPANHLKCNLHPVNSGITYHINWWLPDFWLPSTVGHSSRCKNALEPSAKTAETVGSWKTLG